jgi:exopolysaccharide biosynthesis WecB/TagA/CpsF family protein
MIGVGAAFDYHAGTVRWAPPWMRRIGMEWVYRSCFEPRRMFRRGIRSAVCVLEASAFGFGSRLQRC